MTIELEASARYRTATDTQASSVVPLETEAAERQLLAKKSKKPVSSFKLSRIRSGQSLRCQPSGVVWGWFGFSAGPPSPGGSVGDPIA